MPFFDRNCQLRALAGLLVGAAGVGVVWLLISMSVIAASVGGGIGLGMSAWVVCMGAVMLGFAVALAAMAVRARERARRRKAALAGDDAAMARSRIALQPEAAPVISHEPLVLTWTPGWFDRPAVLRLRVMLTLLSTGLLVTLFALAVSVGLNDVVINAAVAGTCLAVSLVGLRITDFPRVATRGYRTPRRMTAIDEGIRWEPVLGRRQHMRWEDMRLLEVASFTEKDWRSREHRGRRYTLYARDAVIWWNEVAEPVSPPTGELAALLALIQTRTVLVPRTLDRALEPPRRTITAAELRTQTGAPWPPLPRAPDAGPTYALAIARRTSTWRARLTVGGIGLALCATGVLAVLWGVDQVHSLAWAQGLLRHAQWLNWVVAPLLVMFAGLLGAVMVIAALLPARSGPAYTVSADSRGLAQDHGVGGRIAIPWNEIASLRRVQMRNMGWYSVTSDQPGKHIGWPIDLPRHALPAPEPGVAPIGPDELAALVAERSGAGSLSKCEACKSPNLRYDAVRRPGLGRGPAP
jgi:hypothetical protein